MNKIFHVASILTMYDYNIVKGGSEREKWIILFYALLLALIAGSSGVWWTLYVTSFMPWYLCPFVGLFGMAVILIIDSVIGAADASLKGMLASPATKRRKLSFWFGLALRLGMTGVFGSTTSYALTERLQTVAVERRLEAVRAEFNKKVNDDAAQQVKALRERRLGNLQQQVLMHQKVVEVTVRQRGRRYGGAQYSLNAAERRLREEEEKIRPLEETIEAQRLADQVSSASDPLVRDIAMEEIRNDPKTGAAAQRFLLQWMVLLMTIELSYLTIKLVFEPAMVCKLRQNAELQLMAAEVVVNYESRMAALGGVARAMVDRSNRNNPGLLG